MEVRIKFSADLIIVGKDIKDVRSKWESLQLFSKEAKECGSEYIETLLIEDAITHDDLTEAYNHAYDTPKEESKPKFHDIYQNVDENGMEAMRILKEHGGEITFISKEIKTNDPAKIEEFIKGEYSANKILSEYAPIVLVPVGDSIYEFHVMKAFLVKERTEQYIEFTCYSTHPDWEDGLIEFKFSDYDCIYGSQNRIYEGIKKHFERKEE